MLESRSKVSGARAVARCDLLGSTPYSDSDGGLFRPYLGPAHKAASAILADWMEEAKMRVRRDAMGNLIGRYDGNRADAPALVIGSHIDSVRDGGRYDGALGVMLAIECVALLAEEGKKFAFPIEVVAFGDEEGSRFPTPMLCSRAFAGSFTPDMLDLADRDGVSLQTALKQNGLHGAWLATARRLPQEVFAYLEAHIEQGPVLEFEGLSVGTVTGIAAQMRYRIVMKGTAGHAGTTVMGLRRDALAAASEAVLAVERIASNGPSDLVATAGMLSVSPGAVNVIPGRAEFSLDIRAGLAETRDQAASRILTALADIAKRRDVTLAIECVQELPSSPSDPRLIALMDEAIVKEGLVPRRLVSGAGHDAMVLSALCPTIMLFIRCAGGVSHNPLEHVDPADADVALRVMRRFLTELEESYHA